MMRTNHAGPGGPEWSAHPRRGLSAWSAPLPTTRTALAPKRSLWQPEIHDICLRAPTHSAPVQRSPPSRTRAPAGKPGARGAHGAAGAAREILAPALRAPAARAAPRPVVACCARAFPLAPPLRAAPAGAHMRSAARAPARASRALPRTRALPRPEAVGAAALGVRGRGCFSGSRVTKRGSFACW
jgi:hypothetical protein